MSFIREKVRDFYLLTTDVENIFINEYMPTAPGDFVKIYLYGLLYSQNDAEMSFEQMSRQLGVSRSRIEDAWLYWEKMGVIERIPSQSKTEQFDICFKQLRTLMYGGEAEETKKPKPPAKEESAADDCLCDSRLRDLLFAMEQLLGKLLSPKETREIFAWAEELHATEEVILAAAEYCVEKGKKSVNYIAKVVRQWTEDGMETSEDVENHLRDLESRMGNHKKIMQALGLNRGETEAERKMIDSWFDEMHFNMDRVMEACAKASFISSPNLRYVNKVLLNWQEEAIKNGRDVNSRITVTQSQLKKYYEYLRKKAEEEAEKRKKEVYERMPRIKELDEEILDLGRKFSVDLLSGKPSDIAETRRMIKLLEEERAVLLTENNYRQDYTDIKYTCEKCGYTGVTEDGKRCSCVKERMGEAELWQNSNLSEK